MSTTAELLQTQIELLRKINSNLELLLAQDASAQQWQWTPGGLPICQQHSIEMPKREKQGDTWFSHGVTDEHGEVHYCKGYPGKSSPGYHIFPENGWSENDELEKASRRMEPIEIHAPAPPTPAEQLERAFPRTEQPQEEDTTPAPAAGRPKKVLTIAEAKAEFWKTAKGAMKAQTVDYVIVNQLSQSTNGEIDWHQALSELKAAIRPIENPAAVLTEEEIPF